MQSIRVKDKLLIGEYDPTKPDTSGFIDQEAFNKLQNRVIDPTQEIYVDSQNGNDDNDGKSKNKAVRTMSKAFSLINKQIPTLTIRLVNDSEGYIYDMNPWDFTGFSTTKITVIANTWAATLIYPTIRIGYGKLKAYEGQYQDGYHAYYWLGNIMLGNIDSVYLSGVNIEINSYKPVASDYANFLFKCHNISLYDVKFNVDKYVLGIFAGFSNGISMRNVKFQNSNLYLGKYIYDITSVKDTDINNVPNTVNITPFASNTITKCALTAIAVDTTIPDNVLALGNSGFYPSIGIVYKNF